LTCQTSEAGPRILVVEDDDDLRTFVAMVLEDAGYSVMEAANGAAALQTLEHVAPSAILLDMKMPVMDGWQFAARYSQRPTVKAPIIVMTAAHDAAIRATQVQAVGLLSKPFELTELLEIVDRVTRRSN
jgi:CheY-like chemotaxis protein